MSRTTLAIILAAGEGTRMRSDLPKVLHPIGSRPHDSTRRVAACRAAKFDQIACVVGSKADLVRKAVGDFDADVTFHEQSERKGTAHAVRCAEPEIERGFDNVVVLNGDGPLLESSTLVSLVGELANGADLAVLGFEAGDPDGYGRMIMNGEAARQGRRGQGCERGRAGRSPSSIPVWSLFEAIERLRGFHRSRTIIDRRSTTSPISCALPTQPVPTWWRRARRTRKRPLGVNDRQQLAEVEAIWQRRTRVRFMRNGVTMQAPETVWLAADTELGREVSLEPNIWFGPGVRVEDAARIRANSHLEGCTVGTGCEIGPFARIRPGTALEPDVKVGNFVEVKNAQVASGAKLNHLSYLGDATIGVRANIGAGTITCNYDGYLKHRTSIGADAFIGSNSALVAPVSIGARANIGAGSTVTRDVDEDALVLARSRQTDKPGRAAELRAALAERKRASAEG